LRFATWQENNCNSSWSKNNASGLKGINYHKRDKKYEARINLNGKEIYLGYLEEAKTARIKASKNLFGEYINKCEK
jgi:hypothetical protein